LNVNCSGFSGDLDENPELKTESDFDDDTLTSATQRVSNIARQALGWVDDNMPTDYHKNEKLVRAVQRVKGKMLVAMSKRCASGTLSRHDHERLSQSLESLRASTEPLDQVHTIFGHYYIFDTDLLWDKIARPDRKPFGLFYPLETFFSAKSFRS